MDTPSSRQKILFSLQTQKEDVFCEFPVRALGISGPAARDELTDQSDIDLLVEFTGPVGMITLVRLEQYLSRHLGRPVDLVTPDTLKPIIRQDVLDEVIYV